MKLLKNSFLSFLLVLVMLFVTVGGIVQAVDFGGETIKVHLQKPYLRDWWRDTTMEFGDMPARADWISSIEDRFNVNLEMVKVDKEQMLASIMAGDPAAHIIMDYEDTLADLASKGALYPLTDYVKNYDYIDQYENWDWYTVQGEIYGIPYPEHPVGAYVLFYNPDLLEREGVADPYELYKNDEWTWDNFRDILEQVNRDTTGDGNIDQYGLGEGNIYKPVFGFAMSNEAPFHKEIDAKRVVTMDQPEFLRAVEFVQDLYDEELLWKLSDHRDTFMEGDAAFIEDGIWVSSILADNDSFDYGAVPLPKGPDAEEYQAYWKQVPSFMIPITVEEPEAIIELTNAIFNLTPDYQSQEEWEERSKELIMDWAVNKETREIIEWSSLNQKRHYFTREFDHKVRDLIRANEDLASGIEAYMPEAQEYLDGIFGQE